MSVKTEWTWNEKSQKIFNKAKAIIKEDACLKFYDETKPLYIEMDASGVGLEFSLLQTRNNTRCDKDEDPRKQHTKTHCIPQQMSDWSRKKIQQYRKKSTMHATWVEKSHHYRFVREVSIIPHHKPLVTIFKKDIETLSQ